ncbi:MAG: pilin, partial [Candidatus Saccharimonadales bacterium]
RVATASTDPKGTHDVTIVEADCYPDSPTASVSPSISNNSIGCSDGPDATLTLGRHYLAAKKPKPHPGKGKSPAPTASGLSAIDGSTLPHTVADQSSLTTIISVALGIIGAFALLIVTVSGLRYVLSGGNPEKTAKAKSALIYSLVGLAVAIAAEAIVTFVVKRL